MKCAIDLNPIAQTLANTISAGYQRLTEDLLKHSTGGQIDPMLAKQACRKAGELLVKDEPKLADSVNKTYMLKAMGDAAYKASKTKVVSGIETNSDKGKAIKGPANNAKTCHILAEVPIGNEKATIQLRKARWGHEGVPFNGQVSIKIQDTWRKLGSHLLKEHAGRMVNLAKKIRLDTGERYPMGIRNVGLGGRYRKWV